MKRVVTALCASLLCACSFPSPPTLLPPPFGPTPEKPEPARFFFPTGMAIDPTGTWVVVTNSNADRLYDLGATYSFRASDFLQYFDKPPADVVCTTTPQGTLVCPFPTSSLAGKVISGNYTGPLILAGGACSPGGAGPCTAYSGSRDSGRLNALLLDPTTGALSCSSNPGSVDCRGGAVDLKNSRDLSGALTQVEGPFGIVRAAIRDPRNGADVDTVVVSTLVPHLDDIQGGQVITSSRLAAIGTGDLSVLFSATVTDRLIGFGFGAGPMVFDERAREAILGGCYTRFAAASAGGELSTAKCQSAALGNNLLRFVPLDAGASARTRIVDLGPQVRSTDTTGLVLGDVDPLSGARRLYMTTRFPDTVVRVALPANPALVAVAEAVVPISSQPSLIARVQRPGTTTGPELLAIAAVATYETSTVAGKLLLVDGARGRIVGQVDNVGDTPFAIAQFPPALNDASAKLAVTMFGSCSVALITVPYDDPASAALRANLGSCPP